MAACQTAHWKSAGFLSNVPVEWLWNHRWHMAGDLWADTQCLGSKHQLTSELRGGSNKWSHDIRMGSLKLTVNWLLFPWSSDGFVYEIVPAHGNNSVTSSLWAWLLLTAFAWKSQTFKKKFPSLLSLSLSFRSNLLVLANRSFVNVPFQLRWMEFELKVKGKGKQFEFYEKNCCLAMKS